MPARNALRAGRRGIRELRETLWLLRAYRAATTEHQRQNYALALLERLQRRLAPDYVLSDHAKAWTSEEGFLDRCLSVDPDSRRTADRKFLVWSLAHSVRELSGDTVETGVYSGTTSWFICDALRGTVGTHHAFDSFEGLSVPRRVDGDFWGTGDLRLAEDVARDRLSEFKVDIHRGWIPECFAGVRVDRLRFSHIDVDLYEPTRDSMRYVYSRTVPGGVIVCDDYGLTTCPGARRAVDEFMADRPEPIIHSPTGQGIIFKR